CSRSEQLEIYNRNSLDVW
nr:immunoglobulin heavy chain junction region [Macaca mulatta]MOY21420.1 immunoglobulin heavy chain junction region [Macaca mulatta]MOY21511.1 immunoglobulin heavy chain junction region [Macaca mulatta]MOY22585.1 immunoglobulin heavy chain junction region [Macaca mulatta]MOY23045.1 immunoglobulin heavy chain junction region [Macaca mulatta]